MTLIPNPMPTGILAIAAALAVGVQSVSYTGPRRDGIVLIALSIALLVGGGGFAAWP